MEFGVEWSLLYNHVFFAYLNLELSREICIKCSLKYKDNDNSI